MFISVTSADAKRIFFGGARGNLDGIRRKEC